MGGIPYSALMMRFTGWSDLLCFSLSMDAWHKDCSITIEGSTGVETNQLSERICLLRG